MHKSDVNLGESSTESDASKSLVCTDDDPGEMCICMHIQSMCCELPMTFCSSE